MIFDHILEVVGAPGTQKWWFECPGHPKNWRKLKIKDIRKLGQKRHQNDKNDEKMMKFSSQRCKSDETLRTLWTTNIENNEKILTRRALPRRVIYRTWGKWASTCQSQIDNLGCEIWVFIEELTIQICWNQFYPLDIIFFLDLLEGQLQILIITQVPRVGKVRSEFW